MREVRPGHVVRVAPDGLTRAPLLGARGPASTPTTRPPPSAPCASCSRTSSRRQLVSDVPLCTLLSGGLDSIGDHRAGRRAHSRPQGAGPVRSFAVDFVGHDRATSGQTRCAPTPDAPFVARVAEHVGSEHTDIVLDTPELMDPSTAPPCSRARDLPLALGDMDTSLYLLFRAIREQSTVALSGESADEVFGGYRWFHDAGARRAPTRSPGWRASVGAPGDRRRRACSTAGCSTARPAGYQRRRVPRGAGRGAHLAGERRHERRMREICYLHLTRFVQMLLDRKDRMSMAVGLEVRVPFCDHRLVEYVFNTPWAMKTFDGREKSLLRAATSDVLPASVAERVEGAPTRAPRTRATPTRCASS